MLKIKLARYGKKNQPNYRIIVKEAKSKRDSNYIANLGFYDPTQNPKILELDVAAYQDWLKKGAQPTETVADLYTRKQAGKPLTKAKNKLSKKALAKQQAAKEAAKTAAPAETPAPAEAAPAAS